METGNCLIMTSEMSMNLQQVSKTKDELETMSAQLCMYTRSILSMHTHRFMELRC